MSDVQFIDLSGEIKADPRGLSFFPWQGRVTEPEGVMATFHLVSIQPGQTRGNHLHPGHEEWLYPFHGCGRLTWKTAAGQVRERTIAGGRTMVRIPPGLPHALTNPGPEILYLLAWRQPAGPGATGPETVPHSINT
jgi:oxalate decarboxylase/phosphoglucose isomerase-like protein (cupin superfamily)